MRGAYSLGPGSEIGLIVCAADLRRFRLRFLGHSLSLVVDCSSNRLDGRLTFQKGFNRAFGLSAFMSSSGRQRPYPIPPLLPQLAESTLKVNQMLVLNHFRVLSSLSDMRQALAAFTNRSATSFAAPA
jgi:hypothetical protein